MKRSRGFSLIELMIALAIVGILAAVAVPSYKKYVVKANRSSAQAAMMDISNRQQQYLLDARTYAIGTNALTTLNYSVPSDVSKNYTITVGPSTATVPPSFTITATPTTTGTQSSDGALTLDSSGQKTLAGAAGW